MINKEEETEKQGKAGRLGQTRSFYVLDSVFKRLEKESKEKGYSMSVLLNSILRKEFEK